MRPNKELAAKARSLASAAPANSLDRRAYGCLSVLLATSTSLTAARKGIDEILNEDVRQAAGPYFDQLCEGTTA